MPRLSIHKEEMHPHKKTTEDPMYCDYCNPNVFESAVAKLKNTTSLVYLTTFEKN
jgi:hypothetical protein